MILQGMAHFAVRSRRFVRYRAFSVASPLGAWV